MAMGRVDEAVKLAEKVLASAKSESDRAAAESSLLSAKRYQAMLLEQKQRAEEEAALLKEWEELRRREDAERAKVREESERLIAEREAAAAQSVKTVTPTSAPPNTPAKIIVKKLEGIVFNVGCSSPYVLELILNAAGKQYKFRSQNFYKVQFWALGYSKRKNFQPCTDLKGLSVQLEYSEALGKDYRGDILSISVKK